MQAITFEFQMWKYLLVGALSSRWHALTWSPLAPTGLRSVPEPALPGPDWVRVRPRLAGLCGSDLGIIHCRESFTLEPFASFPLVLGHEVCGEVVEWGADVEGFEVGDRVVINPLMSCVPRGIDPPCARCQEGRSQLCTNFSGGGFERGFELGGTKGLPGFFSEGSVAHRSQLWKVPDGVSDENAVLTDPLAGALHAILSDPIQPGETVLVVGSGVIGVCTIAALRALHPDCRVWALEPSRFQGEMGRRFGAEHVFRPRPRRDFYRDIAERTGAQIFFPSLTEPLLIGGVDRVFDTVGTAETIHRSFRVLRNGGSYSLIGIARTKAVDWTPVWLKELTLRGVCSYGVDAWNGRRMHNFELALRLFADGSIDLSPLVTHRFALREWREALRVASNKGRYEAMKVAFEPLAA